MRSIHRFAAHRHAAVPALAAALMLTACGDADLPADEQVSVDPTSASGAAISDAAADAANERGFATENEKTMPPAIRGRWGLVPLDCTGDPAAAKGLIAVDTDSVKFYESRAVIDSVTERNDEAISGQFDFTGEGQIWSLDMTWALENDGQTLVRSETGADAAPEPLEYTKCK